MKILVLAKIITWSFANIKAAPSIEIFQTVEQAAMMVYLDKRNKLGPEPDQKEYKLYEVDLEAGAVNAIELPIVKFEKGSA